ncbi:transposase [Streptomyces sp. NPDC008343]|uniref:transposase n=1 Tax=Streptomyces sp. NPDC008343 TaxID=3364828 RepID=UPI0036EE3DE2
MRSAARWVPPRTPSQPSWTRSRSKPPRRSGADSRGRDGGKMINGRKRHLLTETHGLPIEVMVTSAALHDSKPAQELLIRARRRGTPNSPSSGPTPRTEARSPPGPKPS